MSDILNTLRNVQTSNGYKTLVLDATTEEYILSVVERSELLAIATAVERVDERRSAQTSIEAIYILEPSAYSVNCLLTDYKTSPSRYKAAHVFFLPGLSKDLSAKLKTTHQFTIATKAFTEFQLYVDPKEATVFTTRNPQAMQVFYNAQCHDLVPPTVQITAKSLVNVCVMTGEYPIIRYYRPNENDGYFNASILPKMIADEFQTQLDNYARDHADFPPQSTRQRSVFIITDRTMDLFAPLLHEFTYQAMAYDNCKDIKDDVYTYEAENEKGMMEEKKAKLDDRDAEWLSIRHLHVMDAKELLSTRLEEFLSKNQMFVDRSKIKTTSDILTAVARLKGFDDERRVIILHKTLIESLLTLNGEKRLADLAEYEQNLANFGVDSDGQKIKTLADELVVTLLNPKYELFDKLRVIILYGLYRGGLIEEDYIKLLHLTGLQSLQEMENTLLYIKNFEEIGFKLVKPNLKSRSIFKREFLHESISEGSYNTSRFRPSVDSIISKVTQNSLEQESFPYVKDQPPDEDSDISRTNSTSTTSLRNPKHKPAWARTNSVYHAPRQRIFYFIAGGMTHSEMRTAYELSAKFEKDVIIGSDEVLTPRIFLQNVHNLSVPRADLRLYTDWKRSRPSQPPAHLLGADPKPVSIDRSQQPQPSTQPALQTNPAKPALQPTLAKPAEQESPSKNGKRGMRFKKLFKG